MKSLCCVTFALCGLGSASAAEAWLLEMDPVFHKALMKRFVDGDAVACRQAIDKLPELIEAGKIKELELVTSGSETGGKIHPKAEEMRKLSDGSEYPYAIGTTYSGGSGEVDAREFRIDSANGSESGELVIKVAGRLGTEWQPVFSVEAGGKVEVLLERDPDATGAGDFWKPHGVLTFAASVPEGVALSWMLAEGHPVLAADAGEQLRVLEFRDLQTKPIKDSPESLQNFGTSVLWNTAAEGIGFEFEMVVERGDSSSTVLVARAAGGPVANGKRVEGPITQSGEGAGDQGETDDGEKGSKPLGVATATLLRIP